jgi:hypothetical protein
MFLYKLRISLSAFFMLSLPIATCTGAPNGVAEDPCKLTPRKDSGAVAPDHCSVVDLYNNGNGLNGLQSHDAHRSSASDTQTAPDSNR